MGKKRVSWIPYAVMRSDGTDTETLSAHRLSSTPSHSGGPTGHPRWGCAALNASGTTVGDGETLERNRARAYPPRARSLRGETRALGTGQSHSKMTHTYQSNPTHGAGGGKHQSEAPCPHGACGLTGKRLVNKQRQ